MREKAKLSPYWLWLLGLLPLLYVASIGPVTRAALHYQSLPWWVEDFYAPLLYLGAHWHWFSHFLEWYCAIWTG